jgi:putative membrane protein
MLGSILTLIIGVMHFGILALEMFFWTSERARRAFNTTPEFAASTKVLAANQGLYNGFIAAGLVWGAWLGVDGKAISTFFLLCVAIAGTYGAMTASRRIIFVQTVPALVALAAVHFG